MPSLSGLPEIPCPKCGKKDASAVVGDICVFCRDEIQQRANRIGRRGALLSTLLMAVYVWIRIPRGGTSALPQMYGVIAVAATYIIMYRIISRVAFEVLK
ncbi:MAG: hypothetical protein ACYSUI_25090 [Planctomycetota bacterium]|jgi:hypothetical protein